LVLACSEVVLAQQTDRTTPDSDEQTTSPDSSQSPGEVVPGEVLVKFKDRTSAPKKQEVHGKKGGKEKKTIQRIDVQVVEVPSGKEKSKAKEYKDDPSVEFAEPNGFYHAIDGTKAETSNTEEANTETSAPSDAAKKDRTKTKTSTNEDASANWTPEGLPNDSRFGKQWQYRQTSDKDIDAEEAWKANYRGDSGIAVAVLDTGIDQSHEDLKRKLIQNKDFTSSSIDDKQGHGTHVAGSAAASTDNKTGVAGTCPNCSLYNAKVLDNNGSGQFDWVANGITWAVDPNNDGDTSDGAKVINMSLGGEANPDTVRLAVEYAWDKGVVVAAAAGNAGKSSDVYSSYPAAYPQAIAVASTNSSDVKSSTSNFNGSDPSKHYVDVAAPGVSILSTAPDHRNKIWTKGVKYGTISGTSMATPHVAGLAGLVWAAKDPAGSPLCSTNTCVREYIEQRAENISGTGTYWTYGRVNANSSLSNS
jgi:thermitase